jgi:hypothetical protein
LLVRVSVFSSTDERVRVSPPHMPREDGFSHPADTSKTNLAPPFRCKTHLVRVRVRVRVSAPRASTGRTYGG